MSGVVYRKILKKDENENEKYVITYYDAGRGILEYCADPTKHTYVRVTEVNIKNDILIGKNNDEILKFEILNETYDLDDLFEYSIEKNFFAIDTNGEESLYQINAIENNVFQITDQNETVPNTIELDLYSGIEREGNTGIIFLKKIDYDDDDDEEIDYLEQDMNDTFDTNEFIEKMKGSNVNDTQILKFDNIIKNETITNTILRNEKNNENIKNSKYLFRVSNKFPEYNDQKNNDTVDYDENTGYNNNIKNSLETLRIKSGNIKVENRTKVLSKNNSFIARPQYLDIENTHDKVNFQKYIFKFKTTNKEYKVDFENIPLETSDIKRFKDSGVPDYIILKFLNTSIYELKKEFHDHLMIFPSENNINLSKTTIYDNDNIEPYTNVQYTTLNDKPFKITKKINRISDATDNTDNNEDLLRTIWNSSGVQEKLNILSELRYIRHAREKEDVFYYYDINTNQKFIPIHEYYRLHTLLSKNDFYKNALKDQWVSDTNTEESYFKSLVNSDKILENNNEFNDKPLFGMNTIIDEIIHVDEEIKRLSEIDIIKATLKDSGFIANTQNDVIMSLFEDTIEDFQNRIHLSKMNNVEYITILYNIRKYENFIEKFINDPSNKFTDILSSFYTIDTYLPFINILKELVDSLNIYVKRFDLGYETNRSIYYIDKKVNDIRILKSFLKTNYKHVKKSNYDKVVHKNGKSLKRMIDVTMNNFIKECVKILKEVYSFYADESKFDEIYNQNHNNNFTKFHNMFVFHIKPNIITNPDSVFNIIKKQISDEVKKAYDQSTLKKKTFNYSYEQRKYGNRDKIPDKIKKKLNVSDSNVIDVESYPLVGLDNKKTQKINKLKPTENIIDNKIDTSLEMFVENENIARKMCYKIKIIISSLLKKDNINNIIENKYINNTQTTIINKSAEQYTNVNLENFRITSNYTEIVDNLLSNVSNNKYSIILGNIIFKLFEKNNFGNSKKILENEIRRSIKHIQMFDVDVKNDNLAKLQATLIEKEAEEFIRRSKSGTDMLDNYTRTMGIGDYATIKMGGIEVLASELQNREENSEFDKETKKSDEAVDIFDYANNLDDLEEDQDDQN